MLKIEDYGIKSIEDEEHVEKHFMSELLMLKSTKL